MTLQEKLENILINKGLFPNEATEIVESAKKKITENGKIEIKWSSPPEEYPPQLLSVLMLGVNDAARDWIAKHKPDAWYRDLFD